MDNQDQNLQHPERPRRGRPSGKNRVPLNLEERRARNALYEKERREETAKAMTQLAIEVGCDPNTVHSDLLATVISFIRSKTANERDDVESLRSTNERLMAQIADCEHRLAMEGPSQHLNHPGNSANILNDTVKKKRKHDGSSSSGTNKVKKTKKKKIETYAVVPSPNEGTHLQSINTQTEVYQETSANYNIPSYIYNMENPTLQTADQLSNTTSPSYGYIIADCEQGVAMEGPSQHLNHPGNSANTLNDTVKNKRKHDGSSSSGTNKVKKTKKKTRETYAVVPSPNEGTHVQSINTQTEVYQEPSANYNIPSDIYNMGNPTLQTVDQLSNTTSPSYGYISAEDTDQSFFPNQEDNSSGFASEAASMTLSTPPSHGFISAEEDGHILPYLPSVENHSPVYSTGPAMMALLNPPSYGCYNPEEDEAIRSYFPSIDPDPAIDMNSITNLSIDEMIYTYL